MIRSLESEVRKPTKVTIKIPFTTDISFLRLEYSVIKIQTKKTMLARSKIHCKGHRITWKNRKRTSTESAKADSDGGSKHF